MERTVSFQGSIASVVSSVHQSEVSSSSRPLSVEYDENGSIVSHGSMLSTNSEGGSSIVRERDIQLELERAGGFRLYCGKFSESGRFSGFILSIIFLNTIVIALQATGSIARNAGYFFQIIDSVFLGIYLFEMLVKIFALRKFYFASAWNRFDCLIVLASILDLVLPLAVTVTAFNPKIFRLLRIFRAIRAIRALRVLRSIKFLRSLQVIVTTLIQSIPAMSTIIALIGLVTYVWAVIGRALYADVDPERFGSLALAFLTLFQLMTMDDWFFMYSDNAEGGEGRNAAHIIVYLVSFIILCTFVLLNLFIAVIVDNLQNAQNKLKQRHKPRKSEDGDDAADAVIRTDTDNAGRLHSDNTRMDERLMFASRQTTHKQRKLLRHFCVMLAAIDYNAEEMERHRVLVDKLVAICEADVKHDDD